MTARRFHRRGWSGRPDTPAGGPRAGAMTRLATESGWDRIALVGRTGHGEVTLSASPAAPFPVIGSGAGGEMMARCTRRGMGIGWAVRRGGAAFRAAFPECWTAPFAGRRVHPERSISRFESI